MSSEVHTQEIEPKPGITVGFRQDLRPPEVNFGRCSITGEWGAVVSIDLGNLSVEAPNVTKGVVFDERTQEVTFTVWDPVVFEQQLSVSRDGLLMLVDFLDKQECPIPSVTPLSIYQWAVMYKDGSVISQFFFEEDTEVEQHSGVIDHSRLQELRVLPHGVDNDVLPQYAYVPDSDKFYKNGAEIDTMFDGVKPEGAETVYCRQNTITTGSVLKPGSLARSIQLGHMTTLQCFGWCVGGIQSISDPHAKKCLVCVDERGNWRPWKYTE